MKSRISQNLAICALALLSMAAQAVGLADLSALVLAHPDALAALGAIGLAGQLSEVDLGPVFQEFARNASAKIETAERKAETAATQVSELAANLRELEQKSVGIGGGGSAPRKEGPGDLVIKAAGLDQLRSGELKSLRVPVGAFQLGQTKATVTSADVYGQPIRDPESPYAPLARPVAVRDLLPVRQTTAGSIDYLKAGHTGAAAIQANEGDLKAELAMVFTPASAGVKTVAVWVPVAQQTLADNAYLADFLESELRYALQLEEDRLLLKGSGVDAEIEGMWTAGTAYARAVAGDTAADTLRRAITQVQLARGVPTGIILNPQGLERLELQKDTDGNYVLSFPVTLDQGRTVAWRVPVVVSDAMGAAEFLVADFQRGVRLWDRQQAVVEISTSHADFFTRNLAAVRAEERIALTIPKPDLIVRGTFA
jgi:HK97 family phage major capsid protein